MTDFTDLIGRQDINDLEAILSITNEDVDAVVHEVSSNPETIFTWDYERSRPALVKLYEKAKTSQWNGETDLPWDTDVDQEKVVLANATDRRSYAGPPAFYNEDRPQLQGPPPVENTGDGTHPG